MLSAVGKWGALGHCTAHILKLAHLFPLVNICDLFYLYSIVMYKQVQTDLNAHVLQSYMTRAV